MTACHLDVRDLNKSVLVILLLLVVAVDVADESDLSRSRLSFLDGFCVDGD